MKLLSAYRRIQWAWADWRIRRQAGRVESALKSVGVDEDKPPVVFFNASTRLYHLSLNSAFSLLASWRLRFEQVPVRHLVCQAGMVQCILGTRPDDPYQGPPCARCIGYSRGLFPAQLTDWLAFEDRYAGGVRETLKGMSLDALTEWTYRDYPLGKLVLPGLRWALRRHHLPWDPATRALFRQYLVSAANIVDHTQAYLERVQPQCVVVFNGVMYPEAVVRSVAGRKGIRVVSHEVGLQAHSAFFTEGEATFREIPLPEAAELDGPEDERLNRYLEGRRSGKFSMAGIKFWPEIQGLPRELTDKIREYGQVVPVFTNVVFDTSQVHANTIYSDMYAWLDDLITPIQKHPDTLFLIRAHPDEDRPGKSSRESVADWFESSRLRSLDNVVFLGPSRYVSSYDLIDCADFVLVYNSSIGLEAALEGVPVLSAGRARYTEAEIAASPSSQVDYQSELMRWLDGTTSMPIGFQSRARQFLYSELFQASLDLSEFLSSYPGVPGMVTFTDFGPWKLISNPALSTIHNGIVQGEPFLSSVRSGTVNSG